VPQAPFCQPRCCGRWWSARFGFFLFLSEDCSCETGALRRQAKWATRHYNSVSVLPDPETEAKVLMGSDVKSAVARSGTEESSACKETDVCSLVSWTRFEPDPPCMRAAGTKAEMMGHGSWVMVGNGHGSATG